MKKLSTVLAFCGVLALPTLAHADTFNYTASASGIGFNGSGTITATSGANGTYTITGVTGTGVTNLIAAGGYHGNDNLLFPTGAQLLDANGFAFRDVMGNTAYNVDIFYSAALNGYQLILTDSDNQTQQFAANFAVSAQTPEPSGLILLGTGALAMAGMARRRFLQA